MTPLEFVLLGHPVQHSMSPVIHSVVYQRHGLPHRYVTVDCPTEEHVREQIEALRQGRIAGANVTVPWKRVALRFADRADETASAMGAANTLVRESDGSVVAHNTDVEALRDRIAAGVRPGGREALILGNGGAALAAVVACRRAGFDSIGVTARGWRSFEPISEWKHREEFERLGAKPLSWDSSERGELHDVAREAAVIVQATSAGMAGHGGGEAVVQVIPWHALRSDVFLYDLVYNPPITPFLLKGRALELASEGGLSMLVEQAALAIGLWLGVAAPRVEMTAAAERLLLGLRE